MLIRELCSAMFSTLCFFILTAVLYPLLLLGIGLIFPIQASGSLIDAQGNWTTDPSQAVGSALIGQPFQEPHYFWGRPSAVDYSTADPSDDPDAILQTGVSGATNLAPSNPELRDLSLSILEGYTARGLNNPPADLVYSSGSGLDPHISPAAALVQIERVAEARNIDASAIEPLIQQATEGRFLGIFGEPGVNVLRLNIALDQAVPRS